MDRGCPCMRLQPAQDTALSPGLVNDLHDRAECADTNRSYRIPANCAHTAVATPTSDPPAIEDTSPRPYKQLNSGTVVLNPSLSILQDIIHVISTSPAIPTYSFPDQDLLSDYFRGRWKPLSWRYNALKTLRIIHTPLWSDDEVRCLHYILHDKPWNSPRGTGGE